MTTKIARWDKVLATKGEVRLIQSRKKVFGLTLISLFFGVFGVMLVLQGEQRGYDLFMAWASIIFFGLLGTPVLAYQLFHPKTVTVSLTGLQMNDDYFIPWQSVEEVFLWRVANNHKVAALRLTVAGEQIVTDNLSTFQNKSRQVLGPAADALSGENTREIVDLPHQLPGRPKHLVAWLQSVHERALMQDEEVAFHTE